MLWGVFWYLGRRRWSRRRRVFIDQRRRRRGQTWEVDDDMWGRVSVTQRFENEIFLFQKWMNSDSFCYFCAELIRAPKIIKIFV